MAETNSLFFRVLEPLFRLSVSKLLVISFLFAIFLGSIGLYVFEEGQLSYVDCIYLSASAICVTGLSTVPIALLTIQSQFLLLVLIQLGGIGIITFTVLVGVLIVKGLSRNERILSIIGEATDTHEEVEKTPNADLNITRMIFSIIKISLTMEAIGAVLIFFQIPNELANLSIRIYYSLFTAVSAFNNAGFSLSNDLSIFRENAGMLYTISILVILGGMGFPVIIFIEKVLLTFFQAIVYQIEVLAETKLMQASLRGEEVSSFYYWVIKTSFSIEERIKGYNEQLFGASNRVQTKLLFLGTIVLLLLGSVIIYILEHENPRTLYPLSFHSSIANAFFLSVCARTAGFNTMHLADLNDSTSFLICILMFIGGGPQGTAGGIKITTFFILIVYLLNVLNPARAITILGETVSKNSVAISIRIYFLGTTFLALMIFILSILGENRHSLHHILFEVTSAFATVGYSLGITPYLKNSEKLVYCVIMFVGRIGIFTTLIAFTGSSGIPKMGMKDDGLKIQVG